MSSENDADIKVEFRFNQKRIIDERYLSQINQRFKNHRINTSIIVRSTDVFEALVSNSDGANSREVTIFADALEV